MSFIGKQEILEEKDLKNGFIRVVLKADKLDQLTKATEEVDLPKSILETLRSDEPNEDDTALRYKRCEPVIEEILLTLLKNNIRLHDLTHIFQSIEGSIKQAQLKHERKHYGNNEYKRTIQAFSKEMYE